MLVDHNLADPQVREIVSKDAEEVNNTKYGNNDLPVNLKEGELPLNYQGQRCFCEGADPLTLGFKRACILSATLFPSLDFYFDKETKWEGSPKGENAKVKCFYG